MVVVETTRKLKDDPCIRRYLDGLAESTARNRLPILESFFEFAGVLPYEAVQFQRKNPLSYRFVDLAYEWLKRDGLMVSSKRTMMGALRGFFVANRAPLPDDKHRFHSNKTPVVGELKVDEFRKIAIASNPTYAAAFMVQFQSGSGVGELCYINEHLADHVWNEIRKGKRIIKLNMPGRKSKRNVEPYYTFIGADAVDALKRLFHSRGWKQDDVLFRTERGDPLSRNSLQSYFRQKAIKLGLIKAKTPPCMDCGGETVKQRHNPRDAPDRTFYLCLKCGRERLASEYRISQSQYCGIRYRMRTHELRDLFKTECHAAMRFVGFDLDVAKFCMGHGSQIDPNKYDKIMHDVPATLNEYRKALPFLNVLSEEPRKVDRSQIDIELEASRDQVNLLSKEVAVLRRQASENREVMELLADPKVRAYLLKGAKDLANKKQ